MQLQACLWLSRSQGSCHTPASSMDNVCCCTMNMHAMCRHHSASSGIILAADSSCCWRITELQRLNFSGTMQSCSSAVMQLHRDIWVASLTQNQEDQHLLAILRAQTQLEVLYTANKPVFVLCIPNPCSCSISTWSLECFQNWLTCTRPLEPAWAKACFLMCTRPRSIASCRSTWQWHRRLACGRHLLTAPELSYKGESQNSIGLTSPK